MDIARVVIDEFWDDAEGGFYYTGRRPRGADRAHEGSSR